ncbi:hypothetical protein MTO96_013476 [Rhipicephalus appendiculatus]
MAATQFACRECGMQFSGPIPYMEHLKSARHQKKVEAHRLLAEAAAGGASANSSLDIVTAGCSSVAATPSPQIAPLPFRPRGLSVLASRRLELIAMRFRHPASRFPGRGAKSLGADRGGRSGVPRKGVTAAVAKEGHPTKRRRSSAGPRALNEPPALRAGERAARRKRHYGLRESPHQQTHQVPALRLGIQMSFRPALPNPARKSMKDFPRVGHAAPACSERGAILFLASEATLTSRRPAESWPADLGEQRPPNYRAQHRLRQLTPAAAANAIRQPRNEARRKRRTLGHKALACWSTTALSPLLICSGRGGTSRTVPESDHLAFLALGGHVRQVEVRKDLWAAQSIELERRRIC